MSNLFTGRARVRLVVEVDDCGTWGEACDLAQVQKQAAEEAVFKLRKQLPHGAKIIGEPIVEMVLVGLK